MSTRPLPPETSSLPPETSSLQRDGEAPPSPGGTAPTNPSQPEISSAAARPNGPGAAPPPPASSRPILPRQRSFELNQQLSTLELQLRSRRPWKTERLRRAVRLRSPHSPQGRDAADGPPRARCQRLRHTGQLNAWPLNWSPA